MPVRIYDIAKKLGIENKEVLAKAKELGITSARVPSSSLDKITAEFLESHLAALRPPPPPVVAAPEPIVVVKPSLPSPVEVVPEVPPTVVEEPEVVSPVAETTVAQEPPVTADSAAEAVEAKAPAVPPAPAPPKLGEKVGFIQLPTKPAPRPAEKGGPVKLPQRPAVGTGGGGTQFQRRGDTGTYRRPGGWGAPGGRPGV